MCGRFVGFRNIEQLKQYFSIDEAVGCDTVANYNVAPTQQILAIARHDGRNILDRYHWGLVPFWARDRSIGYKMINARVETVAAKPSFREAFKKRRCLIVADGFYEWAGKKGSRQPMYITLPEEKPFAFAGLWEIWHDKEKEGEAYRSCTIITRPAAGAIQRLHHRMPVILSPEAYDPWLDPGNGDAALLGSLLDEKALSDLKFHPVTREMNSVRHNDPSNLAPVQMEFGF